jgi:hypothetical protein
MSSMDMNNISQEACTNLKLNFPIYLFISYSLLLPVDCHICTVINQLTNKLQQSGVFPALFIHSTFIHSITILKKNILLR